MAAKARIQKRLYYKIGEACKALDIQPYVLRYWETEFPALSPSKSRSGQRVYNEKELGIIRRIKELLYGEGYTIAGAKKRLEQELESGALGSEAAEVSGDAESLESDSDFGDQPLELPLVPPTPRIAPLAERAVARLAERQGERLTALRSGIERARDEARSILALLEA